MSGQAVCSLPDPEVRVLLTQARGAIQALRLGYSHVPRCGFRGCDCGAVEDLKVALTEAGRVLAALEARLIPPRPVESDA